MPMPTFSCLRRGLAGAVAAVLILSVLTGCETRVVRDNSLDAKFSGAGASGFRVQNSERSWKDRN